MVRSGILDPHAGKHGVQARRARAREAGSERGETECEYAVGVYSGGDVRLVLILILIPTSVYIHPM